MDLLNAIELRLSEFIKFYQMDALIPRSRPKNSIMRMNSMNGAHFRQPKIRKLMMLNIIKVWLPMIPNKKCQ